MTGSIVHSGWAAAYARPSCGRAGRSSSVTFSGGFTDGLGNMRCSGTHDHIQMIATSEIRISVSKYWILSIINQALSKTKEFPEIESRYFASEEEFRSLLASRQFIKAVILTDVCRYRFYAIPKLCIIAEFFTLHIPLALCPV